MKIDAFMPFYGSEFFMATQCMPDDVALKYLRCVWYYWSQNKCAGLPDDDAQLSKLCGFSVTEYVTENATESVSNWSRVRAMIFNGEFFSLVDGKWQQKRCKAEYDKAKALREIRKTQTEAARRSRWNQSSVT